MTAPNVTLDEQIAAVRNEADVVATSCVAGAEEPLRAAVATLQSIKDAGDGVPDIPKEFPHVPAAYINALSEEGSRAELIKWLQLTWNESCAYRAHIDTLLSAYKLMQGKHAIEKQNAIHYKAMFEQAESEREQFRKDAERYRYLREHCQPDVSHRLQWYLPRYEELNANGLDAAIDSARNK